MTKFPLNTPIKTFGGHEANIDFYDTAGYPCGSIKLGINTYQARWDENGKVMDGEKHTQHRQSPRRAHYE